MRQSNFAMLLFVASLFTLTACGNNNSIVNNAKVSSFTQNNVTYGQVTVGVDSSGLIFPSVSAMIVDTTNGQQIGAFSILGGSNTQAEFSVSFDLNLLGKLPVAGANPVLPNNMPLPIAGVDAQHLFVFHVANSQSLVYLDVNSATKSALIGASVVIDNFNGLGASTAGTLNVFFPFNVGGGVQGTAGLFTGTAAGQNGLAFFADVSSLFAQTPFVTSSGMTQQIYIFRDDLKPTVDQQIELQKQWQQIRNEQKPLHMSK